METKHIENNPMNCEEVINYLSQFPKKTRVRMRIEYKDENDPNTGGWMYVPIVEITSIFMDVPGEPSDLEETIVIDVDLDHEE